MLFVSVFISKVHLKDGRVGGRIGGKERWRREKGRDEPGMDGREQKLVWTVTSCVCRFVSWSEKPRQRSPQNATN